MEINGLLFPDELYYDEHHQWARADGDVVSFGITDYAQNAAGEVGFVELPRSGQAVQQGQAIGSIESGKWVGRLYAPTTGLILSANDKLTAEPRTMNRDPYGEGWVARIAAGNASELTRLMRGEAARAFVAAEIEKDRLAEAGGGNGES